MRLSVRSVCLLCLWFCFGLVPAQADETFIRIFKAEAELELWTRAEGDAAYSLAKTYPICAYSGDLGPKLKQGDRQAPEGFYWVTRRSLNPHSSYHLSFNLGYPNRYDRAHGRTGDYLMVHGDCVSIGCYAMTDGGIEEIYRTIEASLDTGQTGIRVHIFPFRMTGENMAAHLDHQWYDFWSNLKTGYDMFEVNGAPPNTEVERQTYVFNVERTG